MSCVSCEMSGNTWDELCELWHERSCVRRVVWVVRWVELCEMSCVSCEMSGVVWDELCELWDELCERTWVKFSERTRSSSTKCHTKAALERVELCEMSWVRWVVWDELCDLWDERSCVRWNVCIVWDNLSAVERERSNSGGEGGEGKEYKHKNKSPTQRCEEKNHNLMSCVMMLKKARRRIMLQSYNDKITQQKRAQTTNRLTCTDDPLLTCTDDPPTWLTLVVITGRNRRHGDLSAQDTPWTPWRALESASSTPPGGFPIYGHGQGKVRVICVSQCGTIKKKNGVFETLKNGGYPLVN